MDLMTQEVVFEKHDYMYASLFLDDVNIKEMVKTKIYICNTEQMNFIMHKVDIGKCKYSIEAGGIILYEDALFTNVSMVWIKANKAEILLHAYIMRITGNVTNNNSIKRKFDNVHSVINHVREKATYIREYEADIAGYFNGFSMSIKFFNEKEFLNACKKFKVKVEPANEMLYKLDFGKCVSGNDIEGYINYKNITIYVSRTLETRRIIMEFTSFRYDTDWNWDVFSLHPHIQGTSLCMGNRDNDYHMYKNTFSYLFWVDLVKETLNNYSLEGHPYIPISQLRSKLVTLNKLVVDLNKVKLPSEDVSERLFTRHLRENRGRCIRCDTTYFGDHCDNIRCITNPDAQIPCSICGEILERVGDAFGEVYLWNCPSASCPQHVDISHPELFRHNCSECGSLLIPNNMLALLASYRCHHNGCTQSGRNQYDNHHNVVPIPPPRPTRYYCEICGQVLVDNRRSGYYCNRDGCALDGMTVRNSSGRIIAPVCPRCENVLEYHEADGEDIPAVFYCAECDEDMLTADLDEI